MPPRTRSPHALITTRYTRDAFGRICSVADPVGRVTRILTTHFDLPAAEIGPGGDRSVGRIIRARNAEPDVQFRRDAVGRVLTETVNGPAVHSRDDLAGNRIWRRTPSGVDSEWSLDATHQPVAPPPPGRKSSQAVAGDR